MKSLENKQETTHTTSKISLLASSVPTNLPNSRQNLIGREKEFVTLRNLFLQEDINLVTITGAGGTGKTSLATEVAYSLIENFPSGAFFINLEPVGDGEQILPTILKTLKIRTEQNYSLREALDDFLNQRSILLVIDNFEHLLNHAYLFNDLLDKHPFLKFLITSREPLRLRKEQIYPLEPLLNEDAVSLFAQRVQALNPSFVLSTENKSIVSAICKQLDRLPLAIELAAQRTKIFSPQALLARLQLSNGEERKDLTYLNKLDFLSSQIRDLPARHRTLNNTIAWSYGLLTEEEKHIFRVAGIFQDGFGLHAISEILDQEETQTIEQLSSLVDKNLIKIIYVENSISRFSMLNTIREFAYSQFLEKENIVQLQMKYLELYLELAKKAEAGFRTKEQVDWLNLLDLENANFQKSLSIAFHSVFESKNWNVGFQMLVSLQRYWLLRGHFVTGIYWLDLYRGKINDHHQLVRNKPWLIQKAKINGLSGYIYWILGKYDIAKDLLQTSLDIYRDLNDEDQNGLAEALNNVAVNLEYLGEFEKSREYYQESLKMMQKLEDRWQEMRLRINLGNASVGLMDYVNGEEHLKIALQLAKDLEDDYYLAAGLQGIGYLEFRKGNYIQAVGSFRQSISIFATMDVPFIYVWSLISLARVLTEINENTETANIILKCIELSESQRDRNLYRIMLETFISFFNSINKQEVAANLIGCLEANFSGDADIIALADRVIYKNLINRVKSNSHPTIYVSAVKLGKDFSIKTAFKLTNDLCVEFLKKNKKYNLKEDFLTEREFEVLYLLAEGKTNEQISNELVVVLKTVEKHVASIFRKLGVKNRTEATRWAVENKIK